MAPEMSTVSVIVPTAVMPSELAPAVRESMVRLSTKVPKAEIGRAHV